MDIEKAIKKRAKFNKITMQELSKIAGMSRTALYRKMSGKQDMGIGDLKTITGILKCNCVLYLTNGVEELILIDK